MKYKKINQSGWSSSQSWEGSIYNYNNHYYHNRFSSSFSIDFHHCISWFLKSHNLRFFMPV